MLDKSGDEVTGEEIALAKIGAGRMYHNLLWCVPMFVNLHSAQWYTPELKLVRRLEIDAEDATNVASLRVTLERGAPPERWFGGIDWRARAAGRRSGASP